MKTINPLHRASEPRPSKSLVAPSIWAVSGIAGALLSMSAADRILSAGHFALGLTLLFLGMFAVIVGLSGISTIWKETTR